ncbi:hypothetical protein CIPAW_08G144100 [Carya illinoinensis]|uniref:Leucine-rich repeat-containing N-terminal plant-type domain-containing protein n=1 Tax=Carya illinoinensis TaxID=32201 RepID=A0A8T1PU12_CARIL|nr:hypothetical protein CIPAW_08G144100 [Carya illinoinensis]
MKMQFLLSLLLLCLLHIHPNLFGGYLLPEYKALLSVKSSITDDPDSALSTWNASTSHCTWKGIMCHPSRGRVTVLDLSGLRLFGTLSPDLAYLCFLSKLSITLNQLSGAIPRSSLPSPPSASSISHVMASTTPSPPSSPSSRIFRFWISWSTA